MNAKITLVLGSLLAAAPTLIAQHPTHAASAPATASDDIVDVAIASGKFKTLVTAVKAAGLVDALRGDGPFTVFAPTDDAFAKIDQATLHSLLMPENKARLVEILTYHVVAGRYPASKVVKADELMTLAGIGLPIQSTASGVTAGGSTVVKTDIEASNGIIHVVDSVILPPAQPTIVELAQKAGTFKTLVAAVKAADLVDALSGDGPFTVFAPTDEAFAKLDPATLQSLLKPENKEKLVAILTYHVVPGRVDARAAVTAGRAETLQGQKVEIGITDGRLTVDGAHVIGSDLRASNGVVHVIDTVILPR